MNEILKACAAIALFSCAMLPPLHAATFGLFTYTDDGASITITGYDNSTPGPVTIPAKIGGKPVTVIAGYAFAYHGLVTSVSIPTSVTHIGNYAFYYDTLITSVSGGDGLTTIGTSAFGGCTSLTSFNIPKRVTYVGGGAFAGCSGLTSVTIPPGVNFIGEQAFESCSKLTSIAIPNSVTSLGNSAFAQCTGLTSISIPTSITTIGDFAFYKCTGLLSVSIPSSVTTIGPGAFSNCTDLTTVVLPSGLTYIGSEAFEFCSDLTGITIPANVNYVGQEAFNVCEDLANAKFLGNAPAFGINVFGGAAAGFTIYYLNGNTGFTTPTWNGYPSVMLSLPEIAIEQPPGTVLVDDTAKIDFGNVVKNQSGTAFTFKLKNIGKAPLTGLALTVSGSKKSFLVSPLTKTTLAPGGKMNFDVTFRPAGTGKITANIIIASDDADEDPFNIKLTGKGLEAAPTPSVWWLNPLLP